MAAIAHTEPAGSCLQHSNRVSQPGLQGHQKVTPHDQLCCTCGTALHFPAVAWLGPSQLSLPRTCILNMAALLCFELWAAVAGALHCAGANPARLLLQHHPAWMASICCLRHPNSCSWHGCTLPCHTYGLKGLGGLHAEGIHPALQASAGADLDHIRRVDADVETEDQRHCCGLELILLPPL